MFYIWCIFLSLFRPSLVLFSLLKVTEVVMIYDAEKQRPRGKPHIHIRSHSVSLSPHAQDKLFLPKEKRTSRRPSIPLMCAMLGLVCLNSCMVARQISSIHMTRKHLHQTCAVSSASCTSACLKGIVHPKMYSVLALQRYI